MLSCPIVCGNATQLHLPGVLLCAAKMYAQSESLAYPRLSLTDMSSTFELFAGHDERQALHTRCQRSELV